MLPEQKRAMAYLARKGTQAPLAQLRDEVRAAFAAIESSFDEVPEPQRTVAPAPGKWSAIEILDHLVLSHEPAIAQFADLLDGISSPDAVPAGLQSEQRASWSDLREQLGSVHRELLRLLDAATDDVPLTATAMIEMVIKVDGQPLHWLEPLDWKAFIQGIRMHTLEHRDQLLRTASPAIIPPIQNRERKDGTPVAQALYGLNMSVVGADKTSYYSIALSSGVSGPGSFSCTPETTQYTYASFQGGVTFYVPGGVASAAATVTTDNGVIAGDVYVSPPVNVPVQIALYYQGKVIQSYEVPAGQSQGSFSWNVSSNDDFDVTPAQVLDKIIARPPQA